MNRAAIKPAKDKYSQIRGGLLPFEADGSNITVRDAIHLCQKAYANVPIFRNTVDMMSEFANGDIYLEDGNATSRKFFEKLFKRLNLWKLKDQYFREYYKSGNVFLYRIDGKFTIEDYKALVKSIAETTSQNRIPMKYTVLNPFDIAAKRSTIFSAEGGGYFKILSDFDLERLANPKNDNDKALFESLDADTQKKISDKRFNKDGILIRLESDKLAYSFYKKQDYEPFAIPFGFPVLEDINAKLEMKKLDQAIMRTVENVILMITMGAKPDEGGVNANNISAMQQLFQNESVGRVLVADYTTKAEFVIPDISKVVGPEKYEVINKDIKEGLQNILLGEEKYNGAQMKARVFLDRLKEARQAFISDFLQPEIDRISKDMGFRTAPQAKFKDIDLRDEVQLMRVATRLMEVGVITPEQGMDLFRTGAFPEADTLEAAQEKFQKQREKGHYNPLVGGVPLIESPDSGEDNDNPQKKKKGMAGRPQGSTDTVSRERVAAAVMDVEDLNRFAQAEMLKKTGAKKLSEQQQGMVSKLCESIVLASEKEKWQETAISCVNDFSKIEKLGILDGIYAVSDEHQLELYPSALLYHSKKDFE